MFASWGAEEYGLIGSQEWVEEHQTLLQANVIAYVNCDVGVSGNWTFSPGGTPNMREIMHEITKLVDNPRIEVDGPTVQARVARYRSVSFSPVRNFGDLKIQFFFIFLTSWAGTSAKKRGPGQPWFRLYTTI